MRGGFGVCVFCKGGSEVQSVDMFVIIEYAMASEACLVPGNHPNFLVSRTRKCDTTIHRRPSHLRPSLCTNPSTQSVRRSRRASQVTQARCNCTIKLPTICSTLLAYLTASGSFHESSFEDRAKDSAMPLARSNRAFPMGSSSRAASSRIGPFVWSSARAPWYAWRVLSLLTIVGKIIVSRMSCSASW